MKSKKSKLTAILLTLTLLSASLTIQTQAVKRSEIFSPAIAIIASSEINLKKSAVAENSVFFSEEDFKNILNIKNVSSVTVSSLPDPAGGKLMLGNLEVLEDQVISQNNIDQLKYVSTASDNTEVSFSFIVSGNQDYEIPCSIYFLNEKNSAPKISDSDKEKLKLETIKNIAVFDRLKGSDPENDQLTYEIVTYPASGILTLTDKHTGSYKYTPVTNYVGNDSFEYRICDKYGNISNTATVDICVDSPYTITIFEDMIGRKEHLAAIRLSEKGIMAGTLNDEGRSVFDPDANVTRAEFITMAMKTAGKAVSVSAINTGFLDDDNIQSEYKSYIAVASQLGIIHGVYADGGYYFYPERNITRAEASVMLNNILGLTVSEEKPVFADSSSIPSWAENDIMALSEHGILDTTTAEGEGEYVSPNDALTRAETAEMLYNALKLS